MYEAVCGFPNTSRQYEYRDHGLKRIYTASELPLVDIPIPAKKQFFSSRHRLVVQQNAIERRATFKSHLIADNTVTRAQVSLNLDDMSSSTYARCDFVSPSSIALSSTARTSIGGLRPSILARFQRFRRAIPMQGYKQ